MDGPILEVGTLGAEKSDRGEKGNCLKVTESDGKLCWHLLLHSVGIRELPATAT